MLIASSQSEPVRKRTAFRGISCSKMSRLVNQALALVMADSAMGKCVKTLDYSRIFGGLRIARSTAFGPVVPALMHPRHDTNHSATPSCGAPS